MKVPRLAAMTAALILEIGLLTLLLALGPSSIGVPVPPLAAAVPAETPTVTAVDPASAPNDLDTAIVVTGANFETGASVQLDGASLDGVTWISSTQLEATVPWGLDPGLYTLTCTLRQPTVPCRHAPTATTTGLSRGRA